MTVYLIYNAIGGIRVLGVGPLDKFPLRHRDLGITDYT